MSGSVDLYFIEQENIMYSRTSFSVLALVVVFAFSACGEDAPSRAGHIQHPDGGAVDSGDDGGDGGSADSDAISADAIRPSSLYRACTQDLDCTTNQHCVGLYVSKTAASKFCVPKGCDPSGDGRDPICSVLGGPQGSCHFFDGYGGELCLIDCASDADCVMGTACASNNLFSQHLNACLSVCQTDSDCQAGNICDPNAPTGRRLCITPL
jgi:hypothetical protein